MKFTCIYRKLNFEIKFGIKLISRFMHEIILLNNEIIRQFDYNIE